MAVIQDLPPELLHRILELVAEGHGQAETLRTARTTLARAALVARDWCAPSQAQLARLRTVAGARSSLRKYADDLRASASAGLRRLKRIDIPLDGSEAQAHVTLLSDHGVQLDELALKSNFSRIGPSHERLLLGIRRLELGWCPNRPVRAQTNVFRMSCPMALEALRIEAFAQEFPARLLPLSNTAPSLRQLELGDVNFLSSRLQSPLQDIAAQLSHLSVYFHEPRPREPSSSECFSLDPLLSACTSLISLSLQNVGLTELNHLTLLLAAQPVVLNVRVSVEEPPSPSLAEELIKLLDQPSMASLRRWRLSWSASRESGFGLSLEGDAKEEWEAACRARGIEPRGDERYFTD